MKILPASRPLRAAATALASAALLLGAASLPWRRTPAPAAPHLVAAARGDGPLSAGAAEARFALPDGVPIGGFARASYASAGAPEPVGVRALVLASPGCKVALVSVELLLVPEPLDGAIEERVRDLGLDGLIVAATHTHAGPGGYADTAVFERLATGPYDPRVRDAIAAAAAGAIRLADADLAPAQVSIGHGAAEDLARSRSGGVRFAPVDVARIVRPGGAPVAEVVVFAAHATLLGKANRRISGDWPGRLMASGTRGVRLFFQGAVGDQSTDGRATGSPEAYARAVSARVDALAYGAPVDAPLAFAAAEVALPPVSPGAVPALLRPAARNLAGGALPRRARVDALRLGPLLLVAVPAEPVARVAAMWRVSLPDGAAIVSLASGYAGYVEAAERVERGEGEAVRSYYGPELAVRLGEAVRAAADAASPADLARTPRPHFRVSPARGSAAAKAAR